LQLWILTQFYLPEVGAAAIRLGRLAGSLAADGHQVTVLTSMPNYPSGIIPREYRGRLSAREVIDGVDVRRVWVYASPSKRNLVRIANQISFMLMSALAGTFMKGPDVFEPPLS
jgi:colanic acid biosynthesis glycosyl transferase WcaI